MSAARAIVVFTLSTLAYGTQGQFYPDVPLGVYNQYAGPYPSFVRQSRSPDGSSSSSYSSSSGGSSTSGTFMAPGPGGFGSMNAYAGTNFPNNFGYQPFGFGYGGPPNNYNQFDFYNFLQQYFNQLQAEAFQAQAQAQEAANSGQGVFVKGPNYVYWSTFPSHTIRGGFPGNSNFGGGIATAQYSPQGGYGSASVFPPDEGGIDNRFGAATPNGPVNSVSGSFPAAPGTNGIFTSSSSGTSDVNGMRTSFKTATVGVNKDGKVTTYTAHSP